MIDKNNLHKFHKKPATYQAESFAQFERFWVRAYLDIGPKEKIINFYYDFSGEVFQNFLAYLAWNLQGKKVFEVSSFVDEMFIEDFYAWEEEKFEDEVEVSDLPYINLALISLFKAVENFQGQVHSNTFDERLICRCFGISWSKAQNLIKELKDSPWEEVHGRLIRDLSLGIGCGQCLEDGQKIFDSYNRKDPFLGPNNQRPWAYLSKYLSLALKKSSLQQSYEHKVWEITELVGAKMSVKCPKAMQGLLKEVWAKELKKDDIKLHFFTL